MNVDFAASVAILDQGRVLLARRADVEAWSLPGGRVESGESVVQAARREALEETGLEVQITRLVGIYYLPHWKYGDNHEVLFAARPVGGVLRPDGKEVIEVGYFHAQSLPEPLLWWHRQRIADALGSGEAVVRLQDVRWPFSGSPDAALEPQLAASGLSREEFFRRYFSAPPDRRDVLLLGPE